ncbi:MAG: hypothetical protein MUF24_14230 [Chitinophagaceae bacterium]|jgi:hypothetical protein|nr:hypothetical protein [Chitinophagaceae bacterium]
MTERDIFLEKLLTEIDNKPKVDFYAFAFEQAGLSQEWFAQVRTWVHQLTREKLARYADEENTQLEITPYGRYWMLHGGYMGFLHDASFLKEKKTAEKLQSEEKLLEARLKLTQYRLVGFWIALVVSALGLILSLLNLWLYFGLKK